MRSHAVMGLLLATVASACSPAAMEPGERCGSCHGDHAPAFGAAGTLYPLARADANDGLDGATIQLTDARGVRIVMTSNEAGNFFARQQLIPPLQVLVARAGATAAMRNAPSGDCNGCHNLGGGAVGRIHLP